MKANEPSLLNDKNNDGARSLSDHSLRETMSSILDIFNVIDPEEDEKEGEEELSFAFTEVDNQLETDGGNLDIERNHHDKSSFLVTENEPEESGDNFDNYEVSSLSSEEPNGMQANQPSLLNDKNNDGVSSSSDSSHGETISTLSDIIKSSITD
jgi:hypothetical protein